MFGTKSYVYSKDKVGGVDQLLQLLDFFVMAYYSVRNFSNAQHTGPITVLGTLAQHDMSSLTCVVQGIHYQ